MKHDLAGEEVDIDPDLGDLLSLIETGPAIFGVVQLFKARLFGDH